MRAKLFTSLTVDEPMRLLQHPQHPVQIQSKSIHQATIKTAMPNIFTIYGYATLYKDLQGYSRDVPL